MPTLFDPDTRTAVLARLSHLTPDAPARWGRMSVGQMVAHLTDQMHHALGDTTGRPVPGILRNPLIRRAAIYWFPWPRGRVQGPPDAFVTQPTTWSSDVAALAELVHRFGRRSPEDPWPEHALFGRISGRDWGFFCYKHFDHHLTQFGA